MSQSERNRLICESLIACWRRMSDRGTAGSRRLFDAVNGLWAELLRQEYEAS